MGVWVTCLFLRCDSIAYIVYYSNLPAILYHDELSRPELDAELSVYLSIYLSIYLSYICCVCRKHIFGHVLRIDASLDYILLILTKPLSFFYFSLIIIYHACLVCYFLRLSYIFILFAPDWLFSKFTLVSFSLCVLVLRFHHLYGESVKYYSCGRK